MGVVLLQWVDGCVCREVADFVMIYPVASSAMIAEGGPIHSIVIPEIVFHNVVIVSVADPDTVAIFSAQDKM